MEGENPEMMQEDPMMMEEEQPMMKQSDSATSFKSDKTRFYTK